MCQLGQREIQNGIMYLPWKTHGFSELISRWRFTQATRVATRSLIECSSYGWNPAPPISKSKMYKTKNEVNQNNPHPNWFLDFLHGTMILGGSEYFWVDGVLCLKELLNHCLHQSFILSAASDAYLWDQNRDFFILPDFAVFKKHVDKWSQNL